MKISISNNERELFRIENLTFVSNVNNVSYFVDECIEVSLPLSYFNEQKQLIINIELDNISQKYPVYNDFIELI